MTQDRVFCGLSSSVVELLQVAHLFRFPISFGEGNFSEFFGPIP